MPDRNLELRHLALEDRHLAQCRLHIRRQTELIRWYLAVGHDAGQAHALLAALRQRQNAMREHRRSILAMLEDR